MFCLDFVIGVWCYIVRAQQRRGAMIIGNNSRNKTMEFKECVLANTFTGIETFHQSIGVILYIMTMKLLTSASECFASPVAIHEDSSIIQFINHFVSSSSSSSSNEFLLHTLVTEAIFYTRQDLM